MWIENVTRSKAMKEQLEVSISFDTPLEDIELLRAEMEAFVRHPDNSRDFQPDIVLECAGIGTMDKLLLKVEIRHKSNWSNETVRAARRSKFMCALVLALRKVPIYPPGGGYKSLGDPLNPTYSVMVTDELAAAARDKWKEEKESLRLVPSKNPGDADKEGSGKATGVETGVLGAGAETAAASALNARRAGDDAGRDNTSGPTLGRDDSDRRRSNDIEDLRQGLIQRKSTRGRRRANMQVPPAQMGEGPSIGFTPSSPVQSRTREREGQTIDEEAGVGMEGTIYSGAGYAQVQQQQGGSGSQQVPGGSHSMFPAGQAQGVNVPPPPRKDEFRRL
jgi:hypothetical protein